MLPRLEYDGRAVKSLDQLRSHLIAREFDYSKHALERAAFRNISEREIREAGDGCTVIEDYLDDHYGPSALLLGFTASGRPIHIVVSLADTPRVKIVTLYEPDEELWIDYATRR